MRWFLVFTAGLSPFLYLIWLGFQDALGANPVETITHFTGGWTLRLLLIVLAITPARWLLGWTEPMRYRRMIGLYVFFYASLHLLTYVVLDLNFDWPELGEDIIKRPYITVGFTAWLLLVPLAATSTRKMMRRLGRRWSRLHRLVYVIGILAILHFVWLVKADLREPLIYGGILAFLLGYRAWRSVAGRQRKAPAGAGVAVRKPG